MILVNTMMIKKNNTKLILCSTLILIANVLCIYFLNIYSDLSSSWCQCKFALLEVDCVWSGGGDSVPTTGPVPPHVLFTLVIWWGIKGMWIDKRRDISIYWRERRREQKKWLVVYRGWIWCPRVTWTGYGPPESPPLPIGTRCGPAGGADGGEQTMCGTPAEVLSFIQVRRGAYINSFSWAESMHNH